MRQFVALNREMKDDYHYNEAIKTLRTNIQFCGSGIKTIMRSSPGSPSRRYATSLPCRARSSSRAAGTSERSMSSVETNVARNSTLPGSWSLRWYIRAGRSVV